MHYNDIFTRHLSQLKDNGNYRIFANVSKIKGSYPTYTYCDNTGKTRTVTTWCSNDYLGMSQNETVITAMIDTLTTCGTGAGGTRNIAGTSQNHVDLETILSQWYNKQSALVMTSGYVANVTALSALGKVLPDCIVYSDSLNHNSIIEGIRASKCEKHIFTHNDMHDLERLLAMDKNKRPKLIVFESVYSMDGDIAPIKDIVALAKKYNALTYCDEVHAVGMYGDTGSGMCEHLNVIDSIDIIQGTMGKAIGQIGGFIVGNAEIIDCIRSFGNGFIFTTSLPPFVVRGACEAIRYIQTDTQSRKNLHCIANRLKIELQCRNIPIMTTNTHIVPILIRDAKKCKAIADTLLETFNIYVQPINYPTVSKGTERIRLSPSPYHTLKHVTILADALENIFNQRLFFLL